MAIYSDINTIRRDFWDVTDDELFARVLNRAAEMAYRHINRYLTGIYSVPFSPTPGDVLDISDVLTKAYGLILSSRGQMKPEEVNEYTMAVQMLKDIIRGVADIPDATRLATRGARHTMQGHEPIFDLDDAENHKPDKDYMDDLRERRKNA